MFDRNRLVRIVLIFALLVSSSGLRSAIARGTETEEHERAQKAADVLSEIMQIPEGGIPDDLMQRAQAVAVIPHMVKGAFGLGGEYGKGLLSERLSNGRWSAPSFIRIGGGNVGFQLGVEATDVVLVFTSRDGFKGLLEGKVKLGGEASVAAGPVGRHAEASTDVLLKSSVLGYSRSKGLFAGVSLDGAVLEIDNTANHRAYGQDMTGPEILSSGKTIMNPTVAPYVRALEKYAPVRKRVTD